MKTIAVVSDLHAGSTIGLCPPSVVLYEEGMYQANKYQLALWQKWQQFWQWARTNAGEERWLVVNGDAIEGIHHATTQIVSPNVLDHITIAETAIRLAIEIYEPKHIFFVRGTETHTGNSAKEEEALARLFESYVPYEKPLSRWAIWIETENVTFHFAHHTGGWLRPWTRTGAPGRESVMMAHTAIELTRHGHLYEIPDVSIRAHQHRFNDSGMATYPRVFILPGWQLATGYIRKISPSNVPEVGGMLFNVDNGTYVPLVKRWILPHADDLHFRG